MASPGAPSAPPVPPRALQHPNPRFRTQIHASEPKSTLQNPNRRLCHCLSLVHLASARLGHNIHPSSSAHSLRASGFSIAGTVVAFKLHIFTQYEHYYWMDSAACAAAVAADALTTSVLTITLRQSRTGYRHTDTLIDRLVLYTINTGLLTGIANCSALVFAIARPDTFIWIGIEIVAMRLYSNSVLALLNSRRSLRAPAGSNNLELSTRALYGSDDLPGGSGSQKPANLRTLERATTVLRLPEATTSSGHL